MSEVCVDYLDTYRKFFEAFALSVDPSDQLPVKVASYNLTEPEIVGAVADWALQYLEQRKCPPSLIAHLVRKVVEEVRVQSKIDPLSCGFRSECGDFLSLKLMQACIAKVISVCGRYQDNAELSKLPSPHPIPLTTSYAIKNSRRSMEDRHVILHDFHTLFNIKGYGPASYYGVFDGHNGADAAIYSVSHLHQYLAENRHYPSNPVLALKEACLLTDDLFSMKSQRENLHGGTTAVFALLRLKERKLYVAWLGDSQAVLVRHGVPWQIVRPHKPDRSDERDRIEGMGGTVLFWGAWRVNGQLAVSRAIGDVEYKPYVTAQPDVEEITLDGTEDFLILACDGLWDFVTEQEATNAVYNQLQENPEDLEAVSHRLVALAKEQSSQDNVSVVVVFLRDPVEVSKRRPHPRAMETTTAASNNPFAGRNGADLFAQFERDHDPEDVDFGPETDVDMVDDVLLSPTIAAAKKLALEDELELQRQQMKEFDDPEDLERSRDTPTPPAHEVASNAIIEPLGDSGEESEEEWNYIPGQDRKPSDNQDEEDMSSQLNPDAAEFVPVSPTKLLMFEDDAIISASSYDKSNTSIDDVQLPSEMEFGVEIKQRPGDLEFTNGPRQDDYFMRDNFSTLRNKDNFVNVPTTCAELESSIMGLKPNGLATHLDDVPFDELEAVKDMEDKENTKETNEFTSNFGAAGIFGKGDPMTTSVVGFASSSEHEIEDIVIPDTPKSTTVEAPVSPNLSNEDESPIHQDDLDKSPVDKSASNENKLSELLALEDNLQDGLTSGQERTSTSEFESESGAAENALEDNEGFITEHRRSPPIDLSFKPIQNFSDTNPFGALQTPGSTITPMSLANVISNEENSEPSPDALKEHDSFIARFSDNIDIVHDTPTSFISLRSPGVNDVPVPFDELESPREELQFQPPPSADTSLLAEELPKSEKIELDLQETIAELTDLSKNSPTTNEALDNSPGFEVSKIIPYELESQMNEEVLVLTASSEPDQPSENTHEVVVPQQVLSPSEPDQPSENTHEVVVPQQVLSPFDEFEHQEEKSTEVKQEADLELETKEMKLEFESHITNPIENSENTPNELKNIDDTFEVIMKEELILDGQISQNEPSMPKEASVDLISPTKQTNPFAMNDNFSENLLDAQTESVNSKNDFISAIDKFDSVLGDEACHSEQTTLLSASAEVVPPVEPEATKVVSYQTLTPAEEPMLSKTEAYMTEVEDVSVEKPTDVVESPIENEIASADIQPTVSVLDELTPTKSEPVESQVVTETLITALEEKSEVPPPITTEVPSSMGTPPPTPAPGVDGESDVQKADILVAAVAAAGAVAAGAAVIADKEVKKASAVPAKKPAAGVAKKPEPATKAPAKTVPAKTTAAKPAATKTTTTKPTSAATKPSSATGAAKTAPAKPALAPAAAKKPTPTSPLKPGAAKPATVSTAASKPVPKQLPVNKTSATTLKTSSKPTTPTSKPTTPTTPKVPSVLKSPPKPATKSTLATSRPSPGAAKPLGATEKKPLTNGDIKPLAKKPEDATKKPLTSVAKSAAAARPTAPATKTTAAPAKAPLSAASKTAPAKPAMASQPKPKTLTTTTTTKTTVPPIKRPSTAAPTKPTEKSGKEAVTKASSNVKPAVNGKTATAKPTVVKKTDAKVNGKAAPGKPVPKKTEEVKKEEEQEIKIQVDSVTTTNGFAEHIIEENGTMKIEELDQMVVEGVN